MQVVNKRTHAPTPHDVYIGRPSILGNPFTYKPSKHATYLLPTRDACLREYRKWLYRRIEDGDRAIIDALLAIPDDANLVCWCAPLPCHGDVIVDAVKRLRSGGSATTPAVRILMCGSRTWTNRDIINAEIARLVRRYGDALTIIAGDEPNGADAIVHSVCGEHDLAHEMYCASAEGAERLIGSWMHITSPALRIVKVSDWTTDGARAGYLRNRTMLDSGVNGCVAFRAEGASRGTDMMVQMCVDAGVPTVQYSQDGKRVVMKERAE
jgi:hypothetical protein